MSEHSAEKDAGLEARYRVEKINDPTGKHDECRYFVLDPQHDPIAAEALRLYAARTPNRVLTRDLHDWLDGYVLPPGEVGSWVCGRCGNSPESHAASECMYDPVFRVLPPGEVTR